MAFPSTWGFCAACSFDDMAKEELFISDEIAQIPDFNPVAEAPTLLANTGLQKSVEIAADRKPGKEELSTSVDVAGAADGTAGQTPVPVAPQLPTALADDTTHTPLKHPLAIALELGRYAEADRELFKLKESLDDAALEQRSSVCADDIERVRRIGSKFKSVQRLLGMTPQDLKVNEENPKFKLKWGMKLDRAMMQLVSVTEIDGDFLKVLALDLEADLEDKISEDEISQEMFGQPHAHDVSWRKRMVKAGVGTKADDIMMVSAVDALDEPLVNAVCTLKYTLDCSASADPFGNTIPPVAPGHLRTPYVMTATAFTPLGLHGDKMRGVRKLEVMEIELAPAVAKVLGMMPNFVLKKLCRGSVETKARLIPEVIGNSEELNKRMQVAPRSQFLEHIRSHLACK